MGADFLICPDNTIHQALPYVMPRSPLPWLHIADAVMAEAKARGFSRVGLTGTKWLVEGPVYPKELRASRPRRSAKRSTASSWTSWCAAYSSPRRCAYFQHVIGKMKRAGCDAVVLGCTEIPLIMNDANSPLPTLDSTRLLARAALRRAVGR